MLAVALVGAFVGFLGGVFGKGGSAIATPLLALIGIPPIVALASPLPATVPSTLAASYAYWRERLIDWEVFRWCVGDRDPRDRSGRLCHPLDRRRAPRGRDRGHRHRPRSSLLPASLVTRTRSRSTPPAYRSRMLVVAAAVGVLSGLLANSGGFLLAPLFVVVLRLSLKQSFATSLAIAAVLAIPGTIVHAALGHIDWERGRGLRVRLDPAVLRRGPDGIADRTRSGSNGPTGPVWRSWAPLCCLAAR